MWWLPIGDKCGIETVATDELDVPEKRGVARVVKTLAGGVLEIGTGDARGAMETGQGKDIADVVAVRLRAEDLLAGNGAGSVRRARGAAGGLAGGDAVRREVVHRAGSLA